MKTLFIIFCILLGVLILLSLILYFVCFTKCLKSPDLSTEKGINFMKLQSFKSVIMPAVQYAKSCIHKEICIKSYDGLRLHASLYETDGAKATVIMFHGWISSGENDFGCAIKPYMDRGFNILLVNQRAHGKSGGRCICMGAKEKFDCVSWAKYISERYGSEHNIFLLGISMGAATVLMASGLDIPKNVKGIIADCGYTSIEGIIKAVAKKNHIPAYPMLWFVSVWFRLFAGINIYKETTVTALSANKTPVLFVHGTGDDFVPCSMTRDAYDACSSEKILFMVPEAGHGLSYIYDTKGYTERLDEFLGRYIV